MQAQATTRGWTAQALAQTPLPAFLADLVQRPLPQGVHGWGLGHVTRNEADQLTEYQEARSQVLFPFSPHNHNPSFAVDVFPLGVDGHVLGSVEGDAGYSLISAVADLHGVEAPLAWDRGHVQIPGWLDLADLDSDGPAGQVATAGLGASALALLAGALYLVTR